SERTPPLPRLNTATRAQTASRPPARSCARTTTPCSLLIVGGLPLREDGRPGAVAQRNRAATPRSVARLAILHCAFLYRISVTMSRRFYQIGSSPCRRAEILNPFLSR